MTFERLHIISKALTMIYYPIWVLRYNYRDRMYMDTVDGVTGQVLSGRAPGDPLFQAIAVTAGVLFGGLAAVAGILIGDSMDDMRIGLVGIGAGLVILYLAYRFFRHGSEIVQGEFKEKRASLAQMGKQLQSATKALEGLR